MTGVLLGAVADDITGASDLCNTLVGEGMRTIQTLGVAREIDLPDVDAVVVALKSRTAPAREAVAESIEALGWLQALGARRFFFKYCSTFDSTPAGNIGPVADALLEAVGAEITVVCPAYPANGRTVYQGHLFVGDRLLSESSMAHHPLTPMTDSDLVRVLGRQTSRAIGLVPQRVVDAGPEAVGHALAELRRAGVSYAVVDALDDGDLRAIGAACADLPLITGGSGVALGLPDTFRKRGLLLERAGESRIPPGGGPAVVLAGSCSSATREQVRRMAERHTAVEVNVLDLDRAGGDVEPLAAQVLAHLGTEPVLVYTSASPEVVTEVQARIGAGHASALVEGALGELARRSVAYGARRLVLAGGETAAAVAHALGVRALAVGQEIAPGIPWMQSLGDPPLWIALKSGNFGGPDFFLEALRGTR